MAINPPRGRRKGRGACSNPPGRFDKTRTELDADGWELPDEPLPPLHTTVSRELARSIITRNRSPDVPFELSINPYRGCEHGCVYCYARPSHAFIDLSPGLDFETKLFYKADAAARLRAELGKPGYRCSPITLGANTDPYQPIEREMRTTRGILEVLRQAHHPVSIVTKGSLVERDLDILADMARENLASVMMSITTLSNDTKRTLEPRAASPARRLLTVRRLTDAGVPVGVLVAPVIPVVTDHELEAILESSAEAGAKMASYVFIRLPYEVKELFRDWLSAHLPLKADHVMSLIRQSRGGKDYDSCFGTRQRGTGIFADLLARRFEAACKRYGLNRGERPRLDTSQFDPPGGASPQMTLL